MRDLQILSDLAIQALPYGVTIKDVTVTIGVFLPVDTLSRKYLTHVLADIEAAARRRSPEQEAVIDQLLTERGAE